MKTVSIVVPVFNESDSIQNLFQSVKKYLNGQEFRFEIIFVDDGSSDESWKVIKKLSNKYSEVKGLKLSRNVGQHNACIAGFKHSEGDYIITIDADLQDNPAILPEIFKKLEYGYDIVGCRRKGRKDNFVRKMLSGLTNFTIKHFTKVKDSSGEGFTDFGCMLRGYRRWVVDRIVKESGKSIFIPTYAVLLGGKFCEIEIEHGERKKGRSKYGFKKLFGLYFDMITDISLFPVQFISFLGVLFSFVGFSLGIIILLRRIFIGPEVEGVFTLFAFLFILTGILLISVGLIGEYVGRIYREVSKKPRYIVSEKSGYKRRLTIGIFGYSDVGYACLEELIKMGENVVFAVTHKDKDNENLWFRSVAELAHSYDIPVLKPDNINSGRFVDVISSFSPDVIFSFYFRNIFGEDLLKIPDYGCINVHGSLLPQYRGRAPVNWAILRGEEKTGVTFHYMTPEVDAGPIIIQKEIDIKENDTAISVMGKISYETSRLLRKVMDGLHTNSLESTPQDNSKSSYFGKRTPEMGKIDWSWSGRKIYNYVRALSYPYPGAFFNIKGRKCIIEKGEVKKCDNQENPGTIVKINKDSIDITTGEECLTIFEIRTEGKTFDGNEFTSHYGLKMGDKLGG